MTIDNILQRTFFPLQITTFDYSKINFFSRCEFLLYNKQCRVKTSDISSLYTKHNGQLVKIFSTSNKAVNNSVNENFSFPFKFFKQLLTIQNNLSQNPPHQGAPSQLNFHVILCSA